MGTPGRGRTHAAAWSANSRASGRLAQADNDEVAGTTEVFDHVAQFRASEPSSRDQTVVDLFFKHLQGTDAAVAARVRRRNYVARIGCRHAATPAGHFPLQPHPALDVGRDLAVAGVDIAIGKLRLVHGHYFIQATDLEQFRLLLEITSKNLALTRLIRLRPRHNMYLVAVMC